MNSLSKKLKKHLFSQRLSDGYPTEISPLAKKNPEDPEIY